MPTEYEDSFSRQLRAFAATLARILDLRGAGLIEDARAALERAHQILLGDQHDVLRRVDAITAARMLYAPVRIAAYARLVREEAELAIDAVEAPALRQRALELALEALLGGYDDEPFTLFVRDLAIEVDETRLSSIHKETLDSLRSI